jgi:hypothetical protein
MKLSCPKCGEVYDNQPEELIGRYVVCKKCHLIFRWERKIATGEDHLTSNGDKPSKNEDEKPHN